MRSLLLTSCAGSSGSSALATSAGLASLKNNTRTTLNSPVGRRIGACLGAALVWLVSFGASAQECPTDRPNSIYGSGGSAVTATMKAVAIQLAGLDDPISVFYSDPGACAGFDEFVADAIITKKFYYWDADGTEHQCDPPAVVGQP